MNTNFMLISVCNIDISEEKESSYFFEVIKSNIYQSSCFDFIEFINLYFCSMSKRI